MPIMLDKREWERNEGIKDILRRSNKNGQKETERMHYTRNQIVLFDGISKSSCRFTLITWQHIALSQ